MFRKVSEVPVRKLGTSTAKRVSTTAAASQPLALLKAQMDVQRDRIITAEGT